MNWVVENVSSKPPRRVSKPIAFPNSEKYLTNRAQEAVYELVSSPDLAMSTAAKESPEKNPGKKTIQQPKRKSELRISENFKSTFNKVEIILCAYG